jgi:hypothetical protein
MSCNSNTLQCIPKSCGVNIGGLRTIWVIDQDLVTGTTISESAHTVTNIALAAGETFLEIQTNPNNASLSTESPINFENGSTLYNSTLSITVHKRRAAVSYALQLLAEGQRMLTFIALDSNGLYWYVEDAQMSSSQENSGKAKADGSQYTVEFLAQLSHRVYEVDSTIVAAITSTCA